MDRIFFENVRCFRERQEVPLAPLTVLVGENSSGKSTFLALVRIAWDLATPGRMPDFNEEPFLLGSFEQIASHGASSLAIGFDVDVSGERHSLWSRFIGVEGQPFLSLWHWECGSSRHEIDYSHRKSTGIRELAVDARVEANTRLDRLARELTVRPYAFAPIRTRPQRTYDPVVRHADPEGAHVPMLLATVAPRDPQTLETLINSLDAFGVLSGLFSGIAVRRLGDGEGDPFQIQVKLGGQAVNLIDVGYGVSQILPIVVDCLRGVKGRTFLLQQPEVHLHPRAQAELGSFLGVLAKAQSKRFVIETHSDYLVDRIRMDIRDGKGLRPEDVSLLYFERSNGSARIHRIELDRSGNLVNPPPGYRSFFLDEERRFLGG
jgi:hypothetical protein